MQKRKSFARPLPLDWEEVRLIAAVAAAGSFQSAAEVLNSHTSTISRRVSAIEARIGQKLFVRSNDGVQLIDRFRHLLREARVIENGMDRFQRSFVHALEGTVIEREVVRIASSELLFPLILGLGSDDELAVTEAVDIIYTVREAPPRDAVDDADIYLTLDPPTDGEVITSKIGEYPLGLAASPHYLERRGRPRGLDDLAAHCLLVSDDLIGVGPLTEIAAVVDAHRGQIIRLPSASLCSTAVRQGCGIGIVAKFSGVFNPVNMLYMGDLYEARCDVWLSCRAGTKDNPGVRKALEHLRRLLAEQVEIARQRGMLLTFGAGGTLQNPVIGELFPSESGS